MTTGQLDLFATPAPTVGPAPARPVRDVTTTILEGGHTLVVDRPCSCRGFVLVVPALAPGRRYLATRGDRTTVVLLGDATRYDARPQALAAVHALTRAGHLGAEIEGWHDAITRHLRGPSCAP